MWTMHSEAKQTEPSESGAEKGGSRLKSQNSPKGFEQTTFKNQVREGSQQAPNSPQDWRWGGRRGHRVSRP